MPKTTEGAPDAAGVRSFLTQKEAAATLGLSAQTLARYTRAGVLNAVRMGNRLLYREEDLARLLEQGTPAGYWTAQKKNGRQELPLVDLSGLPRIERTPEAASRLLDAIKAVERAVEYCRVVEEPLPFDYAGVVVALHRTATEEEVREIMGPVARAVAELVLGSMGALREAGGSGHSS